MMSCSECACFTCSQRENCNMNGCYGGGCIEYDYFKSDCDDYEVDPYSESDDYGWDDEDDDE